MGAGGALGQHRCMPAFRRIVVAVKDPWARSLPGVTKAAQLAAAGGGQLRLYHGISAPVYVDAMGLDGRALAQVERARRARALEQLERIAARVRRHGIKVSCAVEWDYPVYEAILRHAVRFGADLTVAQCHPTRHPMPWLLRFTDWELVRRSRTPVLLVRRSGAYRRPRILLALDPTHAYAKPARLDTEILRAGAAASGALAGTLHAVHAYDPLPMGLSPTELAVPTVIDEAASEAESRARAALTRALRGAPIAPAHRYVLGRHPIDAILEVAGKTRSDIVVMGAISRSGLKRVFLGNTAERLLDELPCDVLIVKPHGFASRIGRARRGLQVITLPSLQAPF